MLIALAFAACRGSHSHSAENIMQQELNYRKTIDARSAKIAAGLDITDSAKFYKVRNIIAMQYRSLREIHDERDAQVKAIKANYPENKAAAEIQIKTVQQNAETRLGKLHKEYLKKLSKYLTDNQVDKVKDGMTYSVLPITYKAYQEMIPRLTDEEKKFIYNALSEAREYAMNAESSEKKHAWFGKYKGRINNYLSSRGYDMNNESKSWQERTKQPNK